MGLAFGSLAEFDQNGVTASMVGVEQRRNVVSAAIMESIVALDPIETSIGKSARTGSTITHDRAT